jgi:anti-sigma factor RsiW
MTHDEQMELLPWYANGSLGETERHNIEEHLAACASCRLELADLRTLRAAEQEAGAAIAVPPSGLGSVLDRIDEFEANRGGWRNWMERVTAWFRVAPLGARSVMVAQLAVIVLLLGTRFAAGPDYTTQSGPRADQLQIAVIFQPAAAEPEIRALLIEVEARIVDGPSAAGLYTLAFPLPPGDDARAETILKALRARAGVVRWAERKLP